MSRTGTLKMLRAAVFAAGAFGLLVVPKDGHADNLADAMIGAYETSGLLQQNRALLRVADEDVATTLAALRPVIDFIARAQHAYQRDYGSGTSNEFNNVNLFLGARLTQLIFDGGASQLNRLEAQEVVLESRFSLLAIEQSVLQRAVQAYQNVLFAQENLVVQRNNLSLLQEEQRAAEDRFEVGEVTRTDVALAESRVANAVANVTSSRGLVVNARAEYVNAVGRDPGTLEGQQALPQRPASIGDARQIAIRNHPAIVAQQHAVKAADLAVEAAQKELGPNARLQIDLGVTENNTRSTRDTVTTSLVLTQPIYAGGSIASSIRRFMAFRDAERANLITIQRDVVQGVNNAFVQFEVATANLKSAGERIRAAQVAFDGIREEATLGARTTLDVLQAEQELLDANTAEIEARTNQAIAAYGLLSAQGLLTAERLGLAVQIYDPTIYYNLVKNAPAHKSKQSRELDRVLEALGKK